MGPRALAALALAAAGALGACGPKVPPKVVLWVEVDTLRADALGCYGNDARGEGGARPSPAIDALAAEGVLFERAYGAAPWTIPSLATQWSGRWPFDHGALRLLERLDDGLELLPERFRDAGWRTAGVTTNFVTQGRFGFSRGFERWSETHAATGHRGSTAGAAVETLLGFADELAAEPRDGLFLFVLLFEPHYRYEDQPGLRFGPGFPDGAPYAGRLTGGEALEDLRGVRGELDAADVAFLRGRYQGEVARADEAVGRLLRGLQERGMMDGALVVFTADHGEEIMDRGWIGHTRTLHEELVRVPLVVRLPEAEPARRGVRVERPVSQIDLGATVLDLAGIGGGLGDGLSFAGTVRAGDPPPRRYLYLHTDFEPPLDTDAAREKRALQFGVVDAETGLKWVVDHRAEGGPEGTLYDVLRDPTEQRDLAAERAVPENLRRLAGLDPERAEASAAPLDVGDRGTP